MASNTKLNESAAGMYVISATPFAEDGGLDLDSARSLIDFYLGCGVTGITILGHHGRSPKLSPDAASLQFAKQVLERIDGRVPVIVGVSAPGSTASSLARQPVMDAGAGGVMIAPIPG